MTWTIATLLDWTTIYFTNHKIEDAHLEAEVLLAHALGIKRIQIYTMHDRVLKEEELAEFKKLILRRVKREPTAYIIGYRPFMSLDFLVTKEVLIPRPETELLVEKVIDIAKESNMTQVSLLDIGTGSGAIAVSIAKYIPSSAVTATDISMASLELASENAKKHGVSDRVRFLQGDLFSPIPQGSKFDMIISNPPYISSDDLQKLEPEITKYEPLRALDGGPDGLAYYRKITAQAQEFLADKGSLLLETGQGQADAVMEMLSSASVYSSISKIRDLSGIDRVVLASK